MAKTDIAVEKRIYLESNVFIDLIECKNESDEPAKTIISIIEDAKKGRFELFTSVITITEVWIAQEELNSKKINPDIERRINLLWHPKSSPIRLVDVHELIARDAMRLLRTFIHKGYAKTRSVDAIHLVTAQREGVHEFFTSE
jgi:predicted nucleic acid-binding protein